MMRGRVEPSIVPTMVKAMPIMAQVAKQTEEIPQTPIGDPTTLIRTPKFVEEVVIKVMKANRAIELFQTMVIVSLNMQNLILEVNILKNRLATREVEKAMLQEELDKEKKNSKRV